MAKKPDDASPSPWVASGEGTSPERGGDSENAGRSRPRTSLGDGVVKAAVSRIEWVKLLWRMCLVDVLACPCGGRRAIGADISARDVVVAILAHLGLPTEELPIARALADAAVATEVRAKLAEARKATSRPAPALPQRIAASAPRAPYLGPRNRHPTPIAR